MNTDYIKGFKAITPDRGYYDLNEFISYSGLKNLKKSPAHYKQYKDEPMEETEAMAFGSAYHCFMLEPDEFDKRYALFNDAEMYQKLIDEGSKSPRSTTKYKEWKEAEMIKIGDRKIISSDDYDKLSEMRHKLMSHKYCSALLSGGESEYSITGEIETTEGTISVKGRPDYVKADKHFIIDLKTTVDASAEEFAKSAANNDYHIQAALYTDLMEMVMADGRGWSFYIIAQEKKRPYAFNIFEASPQFIGQGRYEYEQLLRLYQKCKNKDHWPGYQVFCEWRSGNIELNIPAWSVKEIKFYDHKI